MENDFKKLIIKNNELKDTNYLMILIIFTLKKCNVPYSGYFQLFTIILNYTRYFFTNNKKLRVPIIYHYFLVFIDIFSMYNPKN